MEIRPYELWGMAQLYEGNGEGSLREQVLALLAPLREQRDGWETLLSPMDWPVLFFALDQTGDEIYRGAICDLAGQMSGALAEMPFYTAYETRYKRKEHYSKIAGRFREQASLTGTELMALADTVDLMSQEIYEYYRELADRLQAELKERIGAGGDAGRAPETGYAILKACCMDVLQVEKYARYGLELWKEAHEGGIDIDQGMRNMLKSQVVRLKYKKGEVYEG